MVHEVMCDSVQWCAMVCYSAQAPKAAEPFREETQRKAKQSNYTGTKHHLLLLLLSPCAV